MEISRKSDDVATVLAVLEGERAQLQAVADRHVPLPFDLDLLDFYTAQLAHHFVGRRCLDVGPRTGVQTRHAVAHFADVTAIDAVPEHLQELQTRFPSVATVCTLIEAYQPRDPFDTILMVGFLEHVIDPVLVLRRCREMLRPGGRVLLGVPNADSLHRHAGVAMGLLPATTALSPNDHLIGHRRVYTWETLQADVRAAGLCTRRMWGGFLKPLSSRQIQDSWSPALIAAYKTLGDRYPQACDFILAVLEPDAG